MPTIGRSPKVSARSAAAVRFTLSGNLEKGKCGKTTIVGNSLKVPISYGNWATRRYFHSLYIRRIRSRWLTGDRITGKLTVRKFFLHKRNSNVIISKAFFKSSFMKLNRNIKFKTSVMSKLVGYLIASFPRWYQMERPRFLRHSQQVNVTMISSLIHFRYKMSFLMMGGYWRWKILLI